MLFPSLILFLYRYKFASMSTVSDMKLNEAGEETQMELFLFFLFLSINPFPSSSSGLKPVD